jgi:serine/threonine protein kinase/lipopolysaccharide biosynthesis regulator YciM
MHCPSCNALNSEESQYCSKCGTPLTKINDTFTYTPPTQPPREDTLYFSPGETFGPRYKIIEEIGRGGMGRVYKAEDKELGITVALKMIHPEYSSRRHIIERFKKETLLARSISHENVIRIYDIGEVDKIKFISMDYVKGQSLKELILTSGKLTVETTISITKQICEAIHIANQKGIVHRDLKPQNILIDNSGKAYVTDFGVAKSVEVMEDSAPGIIIGTIQYISPEQAKGEKADTRSDIYSLGIIMYEMLTGEKPFKAETYTGYIQKHIHEIPASPSKFNPNIPFYLEKIILKCLQKDKRDRYQNAEEILHDLEEQKVTVRPVLSRIGAKKLLKATYASALIILIVAIAYLWIKRKPSGLLLTEDLSKSIVVMPFENNTGDESQDYWRKALSNMLIYDLIQSKLIRVLTEDRLLEILEKLNLQDEKSYTSEDLKKVAEQGRVSHILTGNYTKAEDTLRIYTKLQNIITGELIDSHKVEGQGEPTFYSAVDLLTPWVKSQFNFTSDEIAADPDRNIEEILTGSPQALKYYDQGKQYYQEGKFEKSNEALEKAINIDPGFVIAYKRISENYHYLDDIDQANKYARLALSLLDQDRVSLRERHLIEGWSLTILEDSYDKAIETYKILLQSYPDDEDGNTYLGAIYRNKEEWNLAIERFEKVLKVNPVIAVENFIFIYKAMGLYDKALEILHSYREIYTESSFRSHMSDIYFSEGRIELALLEAEAALALAPEDDNSDLIRLMGKIYHIKDDFLRAEETYRRLLKKSLSQYQLSGRYWLGHLYLSQGNYEKSRKEVLVGMEVVRKSGLKPSETEFLLLLVYLNLQMKQYTEALNLLAQTEEIADDINLGESKIQAIHFRGLTYLEMKKRDEAKRTAEELKQYVEKTGIQKQMRYYYFLTGMIALEEGRLSQSINDLELSLSMLPHQQGIIDEHAFYLNSIASLSYQMGDFESAQNYFEKITSLTTGRLRWGDIYAKSFYWLGKISQKKGWEGKAIENYEKFLQLWENADPDLLETADARKQLDALKIVSHE